MKYIIKKVECEYPYFILKRRFMFLFSLPVYEPYNYDQWCPIPIESDEYQVVKNRLDLILKFFPIYKVSYDKYFWDFKSRIVLGYAPAKEQIYEK